MFRCKVSFPDIISYSALFGDNVSLYIPETRGMEFEIRLNHLISMPEFFFRSQMKLRFKVNGQLLVMMNVC